MTDQEINVAIAEACGWTEIRAAKLKSFELYGIEPIEKLRDRVPNFCNDLNACHEMEEWILASPFTYTQAWHDELSKIPMTYHATALQRCQAFLKAVGKWKEGV